MSFFLFKTSVIVSAIRSKLLTAKAKIVGPAPLKHIPNNPGCVFGLTLDKISDNPGIFYEKKRINYYKS